MKILSLLLGLALVAIVSGSDECNFVTKQTCHAKTNNKKCKWLGSGPFKKTCLRKIYRKRVPDGCLKGWTVAMDGDPKSQNYSCEKCADGYVLSRLSDGTNLGRCSQKKPNIIIMMADDVGTGDIPFYWNGDNTSLVDMPNLERLSHKAVLFEDAHSTPLCAPSRYMLLSGNYPHRGRVPYGTWNLKGDSNHFMDDQRSIAQELADAGYRTGIFGKWHLGAKVPPHGIKNISHPLTELLHDWSMPLIDGPGDIGFHESLISTGGLQAVPYAFFRNDMLDFNPQDTKWWASNTSSNTSYGLNKFEDGKDGEGDPNWDNSAYDMILVNETKEFIERHLEESPEKPFFAYVAFGAVHTPHAPPTKYIDGSEVEGRYMSNHLDMLGLMDKAVGSLMDTIEEKNMEEETIIIFTSDNGGLVYPDETGHRASGPLRGAKSDVYEGGHRVPLLIS